MRARDGSGALRLQARERGDPGHDHRKGEPYDPGHGAVAFADVTSASPPFTRPFPFDEGAVTRDAARAAGRARRAAIAAAPEARDSSCSRRAHARATLWA